jgi:hypothetical protein
MDSDAMRVERANANTQTATYPARIEYPLDRIYIDTPDDRSIQLRLEPDGKIYFCAWHRWIKDGKEHASGKMSFTDFWPKWRAFCEQLEANAKEKSDGT